MPRFSASKIKRTVLPNGLTVITEPMSHVNSVAVSIWVRTGARHEDSEINGISHFIEHMLFKGTRKRTARQIAVESDRLGGNVDAFTMMESTCYQIQTLAEHLPAAFDLVADLVLHPKFDPVEMERERTVIIEEMKMVEDTPDELAYELFLAEFFPAHPLGRPIEGTPRSVRGLQAETLRRHHGRRYRSGNLVVSIAGKFDVEAVLDLCRTTFGKQPQIKQNDKVTAPVGAPTFLANIVRDFEQVQLFLGVPCPPLSSEDRFPTNVLSMMLGGGLSSRLFQKIREEEGLAYNVYSDVLTYRDAGCFTIYSAVSPKNVKRTVNHITREIATFCRSEFTDEELALAKMQLLTNLYLGMESSASRANHNGQQEVLFNQLFSAKDLSRKIENVDRPAIVRVATDLFVNRSLSALALGRLGRHALKPEWLKIPF